MSFTEKSDERGFAINLESTTEILERFHRKLMNRRELDWESLRGEDYQEGVRAQARREWSYRAVAEYYSTSQFGQLTHRLCLIGAPVELIGASTRLAMDECRHAELCARVADRLGGRQGYNVGEESLAVYNEMEDQFLATYLSILQLCCFGETLSVPVLRAMGVVTNHEVIEKICEIIGTDEGYHMNFGWEALTWMTPRLTEEQFHQARIRLPLMAAGFERVFRGGPEILEELAGRDLEIEEDEKPNLGSLNEWQYAGLFYFCMETEILPRLDALGFDAGLIWAERLSVSDGAAAKV